ncbi:MAG: phosphoenolpyruvate--protein phosphotransferase [Hyphomonadaceae bacterium]|nr:phosphoenolpyruvate--protein phosphotransferase [Hyphomonadaceae bacterium]
MPDSFSIPRLLMNRLRSVMAAESDTEARLMKVVRLIAGTMVADVCSVYRRTEDNRMELIATEGLREDAIHRTFLAIDEGLVGQIAQTAQPLSIQDAPRHPNFSYRPETGEDPYHAFLGVPILKGGRVIGVLTVQNRTERIYQDDEIDSLQTIAMVLAEIVPSDETGPEQTDAAREGRPVNLQGRSLCGGLGMGRVRLHDPVIPAARFFAEDPHIEEDRLESALEELHLSIDRLLAAEIGGLWGEPREVIEAYKLLASDPTWAEKLREGVRGGLSAEASIDRLRREHRARFEKVKDPYLRERLHDLEDLDNRLLRMLAGGDEVKTNGKPRKDEPEVLIARRLGPAELLDYGKSGYAAIILEEVATSSHAAIVARGLGIPTVGGIDGLLTHVSRGDQIIVDGEDGRVHLRPDDQLIEAFGNRQAILSQRQAVFEALREQPSETRDGVPVRLMLNAGLGLDTEHLNNTGADGIGLFRTEFQFLMSEKLPSVNDQIELYQQILEAANGRPVHFRTLDLGGDKLLPNLNDAREENPALGWRSIRFALDRPGLFRRQLRALLRAADSRPLSVMFPMVTSAHEFREAKELLLEEVEWGKRRDFAGPTEIKIGAMLETPAFAYALEDIASEVDFVSIGTNDMLQFFHAADRMTPLVSDRYPFVSRPVMRFLKQVRETCARFDIPVSICGEGAGRPLEALCLIGLGYHSLSMPGGGIGPVKRMLRSLDLSKFGPAFAGLLQERDPALRNGVLELAELQGIILNDV